MENTKRTFGRDFNLMVIGQIISLFGNGILRFALPLYLYGQTESATLLGIVTAVSFVPMVLLSPIGGIIADRVNKRNVMVILDFATAGLVIIFTVLLGQVNLVVLTAVVMMILYGIQGGYQPSVQASLPLLLEEENLVKGNAVINSVSSLAGLIGPIAGGMLYSFYGLYPILLVSIACFFFSAVMEMFIKIPFTKQPGGNSVLAIVKDDLSQSIAFIRVDRPVVGRAMGIVAAFNLFLTTMITVGSLVIITNLLGFEEGVGEQLYGYTQGMMAAGGLTGGLTAGMMTRKMDISKGYLLLFGCAAGILPMGGVLLLGAASMTAYMVITFCCFFIMACAAVFSILALSFVQKITPENMIGKVISLVMAVSMCAQPIGQVLYGVLFDMFASAPFIPVFFAAGLSFAIALFSKSTFSNMREDIVPASV